jgi:hypothetical protein
MESVCYRPEELAEILDLDDSDPRRSHLGSCPRCRARLATYEEFRSAPPAVTGPQLDDALSRLGHSMDEEIWGEAAPRPKPRVVRSRPSWLSWPRFPILRPALVLAAVLLVVVIVDSVRQQPSERGIVLRTEKTVGDDFEVDPPRLGTDGSLEVRWSPVTGADSYRVLFLSAKLEEIATVDASDNSLRLELERTRGLLPQPERTPSP